MAESGLRRGAWGWAAASGVLVAVVAAVTLLAGRGPSATPAAGARAYSSFRACLLAGSGGIADPQAAPVWAGMEDASLRTHAMVSYLAVTGPAEPGVARPFLNSLVLRHCDVIVASGAAQRAAVLAEARGFSGVRFVLAGGAAPGPVAGGNVTAVASGAAERSAVASVIAADAGSASQHGDYDRLRPFGQ